MIEILFGGVFDLGRRDWNGVQISNKGRGTGYM